MGDNNEAGRLDVGRRITVYWPDDDAWYKGTVASELDDGRVLIEYDDGDRDFMDVDTDKWRSSETFLKHDTALSERKQRKVSKLKVGSRLSVWWPMEKEYFTGTLTKIRTAEDDRQPHRMRYDDGDKEWTNLHCRKFKPVPQRAQRLHVGSLVSVYDYQQKRHYTGSVTKIKAEGSRPHKVKYDDARKQREWLNLNVHPFLDINPRETDETSVPVNPNSLKKRKREFIVDPPTADTATKKPRKSEKDGDPPALPQCEEICGICHTRATRPRATTCHHVFCKQCIKSHFDAASTCPLCNTVIDKGIVKYDPDHDSFKGVEALERTTAEVVRTYSSASAASLELTGVRPSLIVAACQSKRRDNKEYRGFYWRFQGSKERILRLGEGATDGVPIEQVDLKTGEIIETFSSGRKAHEKTGVSRGVITRVLERRGKASGGGFFWRLEGETHGPWADPEPKNLNPVEQLDFTTGDVLASYISLTEARRAMGMNPKAPDIRQVCDGKGRASAHGFFWRWKGSSAMPNHLMGNQMVLQIRKARRGEVVKEFRTVREAQEYFGHQCCWSTLCQKCREQENFLGFFWQYRFLSEQKSPEKEIVGKRLRVQQRGYPGDWLEGKIIAFIPKTGKHEILYDCGKTELSNLEDLRYEWKNGKAKKSVEQLDLKTGEVLATFDSISDATSHIGAPETGINSVCLGRHQTSSGYFWRYKGSDALPRKLKGRRKVEQLCLKTGRVIASYDTITAAGKAVSVSTPGISYSCNGRRQLKSAGGFGWRFSTTE